MEKQHLTYFKIENFKRFDSFEMSNLGQFNLIVGDNNVGKTSVLEGLCFDEDIEISAANFLALFGYRSSIKFGGLPTVDAIKKSDFWSFFFRDVIKPICIKVLGQGEKEFTLALKSAAHLDSIEKEFAENDLALHTIRTYLKQINYGPEQNETFKMTGAYLENIEYKVRLPDLVPANLSCDNHLPGLFYEFFNPNKLLRKEFEEGLRKFIPDLEEVRIHRFSDGQDTLSVILTTSDSIYPLYQFGDGTVKVARILIHLAITKNYRLMVDEIGSGIHFTRLTSYWKTIIQLCDKYQVQLFATTHSLECQQAFIEALEAPDMVQYQKDARNISLIENKEGEVKAATYDFEQFEYALTIGFNTRGGKR
ncbi:MAG: AAA family ATPase [Rudanella sp.]|nr:AAA family ATPase [Rudanella sp.]